MPANVVSVSPSHHHPMQNNNNNNNNNKDDCDTEQQSRQLTRSNNVVTTPPSTSPLSPSQSSPNSSYGSNSGKNLINNSHLSNSSSLNTSITSSLPGGVVTTQNISTVIKPQANNKSLQFVKIQTPELSKKAAEQIKLAEETKISKSKIKEVEEQEWHNQLLDWKSRRKQHFGHSIESNNIFEESQDPNSGRKVKTFAEMLEQRAKSGNRLGSFHLQRYIGADEEENIANASGGEDEGQPLSSGSGGDEINEKQDFRDHTTEHNSKSRSADSDYEAHSSTSSGFNQLDSKSPSSPEIIHEVVNNKSLAFADAPRCDNNNILNKNYNNNNNNNNSCTQHEQGKSMSFVAKDDSECQLNSTFKQGLVISSTQPASNTTKHNCIIKPTNRSLDLDIGNKEISTRSEEEESDNSVFGEEEEEEEEEQKHLQRIAFEAKLKAFERLTVPGSQAPKLKPPTRMAPKPPKLANSNANITSKPYDNSNSFEERQKKNYPIKSLKEKSSDDRLPSNTSFVHDNRLQTTLNNLAAQSPPIQRPEFVRETNKLENSPPILSSSTHPRLNNSNDSMHKPIERSPVHESLTKPPTPQVRPQQQNIEHLPSINKHISKPSNMPPIPQIESPLQKSKNSHQLLTTSPKESVKDNSILPSPRKPSRDEKDGTVLSVSGKKRCSSCKEELGRGAAAFVVESLSLVYHTNCFRCSVCHANLSNGFRGVDVRVHAGALHCQNCYSRDGLNFSRV